MIPKREKEFTRECYICGKHFKDDEIIWDYVSGKGESQIRVCIIPYVDFIESTLKIVDI